MFDRVNSKSLALGSCILLIGTTLTFAQENLNSQFTEKVIREFPGECPGEGGCIFGPWTASKPVAIYRDRSTNSPVQFKLRKGEKVTGVTSVIAVTRLGDMMVNQDKPVEYDGDVFLKKGSSLKVYYYLGEGFYLADVNGKNAQVSSGDAVELKVEPEYTLWLQVKNSGGKSGWTNQRELFVGTSRYD